MEKLRQDITYATRRLLKAPGFTLVCVLTLGLGIGANAAIFTVVHGVLLTPLPFPESGRLVGVFHTDMGHRTVMSGPNFIDVRDNSKTLENAAAYHRSRVILTGQGDPVRVDAAAVSASLFNVLRAKAEFGRVFQADEDTPGRTHVIILSHALWQQRFGADPSVVGKSIQIDGSPMEVIGVMPASFAFPPDRQAWMPIEYDGNFVSRQRGAWMYGVIARLRPGVSPDRSAAEVETIGRNLARQYPDMDGNIGMTTYPLLESIVGDVRPSVLVLLAAVGFVLLIACANVANLLLARAASRESEMAVRAALGAGRGRLLRQLLTEAIILSVLGAGLGLLLAVWGVDFLIQLRPDGIPRLGDIRVDGAVLLFTAAVAVITGLLFGAVPALHATRDEVAGSLKDAGRGTLGARGGARARNTLVVAELALALMLLVGAGLLMRSFMRLQDVDPGFNPERTLTFELTFPDGRYSDENEMRVVTFFDQLMPKLTALPGVVSSGAVMALPMSGINFDIGFEIEGHPLPPSQQPDMQTRVATPEYFTTIGIPLKRGRLFTEDDRPGTKPVLLLTESAARKFFPHDDPIGKRIRIGWGKRIGNKRMTAGGEIVGIVGDVKEAGLAEPYAPQVYIPLRQWPVQTMSVVVKTTTGPASIVGAVGDQVHAVDPVLPVSNIRPLSEIISRSISQPRFYMLLLGVFAGVALMLAAIGIFGVLSYAVSQRTREIGIRMALGAQERSVVSLVVRQAMYLVITGVVLGTAAALLLSQTLTKMLFAVTPTDPATFGAVAALLIAVALVASYLPARRATRVDPIVALRAE